MKVLIVEDSPDDRELFRRALQWQDGPVEFFEAGNVHDGLALAQKEKMDCILVDYKLPDGDGMCFIHSLRSQQLAGQAAIVMVTGQGEEKTAVEAMKLGAHDYITKDSIPDGFFRQSVINAIERARLKKEIANYQSELVRSNAALSEFTHTAAHDLKAPLRHIASYCGLLQEDESERLSEEGKGYVKRLIVNANRLQKLVENLLNYSEVMNAKDEREPVDCNTVVAEALEIHEQDIKEKGAKIKLGQLPVIQANAMCMKQLFQNLISNALKYSAKDRAPEISIACSETGPEYVFSVADNGCGIEDEHKEMIFKAFKRLHSKDSIEGTGLGLSICQKVVDMLGGKIWLESKAGQGTTFFFTIPKTAAA
jgi:signal transduction histidine kinase